MTRPNQMRDPEPSELGYHPQPALEGEVVAGPGAEPRAELVVDNRGMVAIRDGRTGLPAVPPKPKPERETKERKALRLELEQAELEHQRARDRVYSLRLRYEASGPRAPEWGP